MDTFTGVQITVCGLLALGGVLKLFRPDPGRTALARLGLRLSALPVRLIGLTEVALALATALVGGRLCWLAVTVAYVAFSAVGAALWKLGGVSSCGCFGATETPPGPVHVVVTGLASVVSGAAAAAGVAGPLASAARSGLAGWATIASGSLLLSLVYLCLVAVPPLYESVQTSASARDLARSGRP